MLLLFFATPGLAEDNAPVYGERPVWLAGSRFLVVLADTKPSRADSDVVTYRIVVQRSLRRDGAAFVSDVKQVLHDEAGWQSAGVEFVHTDRDADIDVVLAKPATVDKLCRPLKTGGSLSCGLYGRAVLNHFRWKRGSWTWGDDVEGYRAYLINHEVGHLLGMRHRKCPQKGAPAPVMMQQTKFVAPCRPAGRPSRAEIETLAKLRAR